MSVDPAPPAIPVPDHLWNVEEFWTFIEGLHAYYGRLRASLNQSERLDDQGRGEPWSSTLHRVVKSIEDHYANELSTSRTGWKLAQKAHAEASRRPVPTEALTRENLEGVEDRLKTAAVLASTADRALVPFLSGAAQKLQIELVALESLRKRCVAELNKVTLFAAGLRQQCQQVFDAAEAAYGQMMNDHFWILDTSHPEASPSPIPWPQLTSLPDSPRSQVYWAMDYSEFPEDDLTGGARLFHFYRRRDPRSSEALVFSAGSQERYATISSLRSYIVRLLLAHPPGTMQLRVYDPLGLGENVAPFLGLQDYDQRLIGGKIATNGQDLRKLLDETSSHIEQVIQKYLRGEFQDLAAYNLAAGQVAESYRYLFIFDFPANFTEELQFQLRQIISNGPRAGVFTVLLNNTELENSHGVSVNLLQQYVTAHGHAMVNAQGNPVGYRYLAPGPLDENVPGAEDGQRFIDYVVQLAGEGAAALDRQVVDLDRAQRLYRSSITQSARKDIPSGAHAVDPHHPDTWWTNTTEEACAVPLGPSSARDVALLRFDSRSQSGGFLIGRMGSGKSSMLHTVIAGLTTMYSPEELELYLIDFREGVEFAAYAKEKLPHARAVAIESEREFGLSVLRGVVHQMEERGRLIRATGGEETTFLGMRHSGRHLSRMVLVFDEFQVLFQRDDAIGLEAAQLMDAVIRQGRGVGVHVLLSSQSVSGLGTLSRLTLDLLPVRILMQSTADDAALTLGDSNKGWTLISNQGEAILNAAGGAKESNVLFQAAFETDKERIARLQTLRALADQRGFTAVPKVFEGNKAAHLEEKDPQEFAATVRRNGRSLILHPGAAMALEDDYTVEMRRAAGGNLLCVGRSEDRVPQGMVGALLTSIAVGSPSTHVTLVNFTPMDDNLEDDLAALQNQAGYSFTRPRRFVEVLQDFAEEVSRRVDEDNHEAPARVLVLFGVHLARVLGQEPYSQTDLNAPNPDELLKQILQEGPEVGVHLIAWADNRSSLNRRIPSYVQEHFGLRLATSLNPTDSDYLLNSQAAAGLKGQQSVFVDLDHGREIRLSTYAVPAPEWLDAALSV